MNNQTTFIPFVTAGPAPAAFEAALFDRAAQEDLAAYGPEARASLAETAWLHLALPRKPGAPSLRLFDFDNGDSGLNQITLVEAVNDDMPYLLDTTLAELAAAGLSLRLVAHPIFAVERDESGRLLRVHVDPDRAPPGAERESLIHIHVERIVPRERRDALLSALETDYAEVRVAMADQGAMVARIAETIESLRDEPPALQADEIAEAVQFLRWILSENFIILGQRLYRFEDQPTDADAVFEPVEGLGLGILRSDEVKVLRRGRELVALTPEVLEFLRDDHVLIVTKANVRSRVHKRVHMDYIGVKRFDADGRPVGELRIVGLFTRAAYTQPTHVIPYIRHKVARALESADLDPDSHSGRMLAETFETYPRDELFQIDVATLVRFAGEIAALQERPRLRALTRFDRFDRFVSVLVFIPRERFDTPTQTKIGETLAALYDGRASAAYPAYLEGPLARIHYIIGRTEGRAPAPEREIVENAIADVIRTWSDALRDRLLELHGLAGHAIAARWATAFSAGYREAFDPRKAIEDIALAQRLSERRPKIAILRRNPSDERLVDLEVFSLGRPMPLSERAPVVESMGMRVISERTFDIAEAKDAARVWIHAMAIETTSLAPMDLLKRAPLVEAAIAAVFRGDAENDGYNALVLNANLGWREAAAVRALSRYLRQIGVSWPHSYMCQAVNRNAEIAERLIALFAIRFDPALGLNEQERGDRQASATADIEALLRNVASLDDDRILRRLLNLILAAVRTNYFQPENERPAGLIVFKFDSRKIDDLPRPRPLYEIMACSPQMEGVHLRFGHVARGGLRWSDRPQDFRTEVLGLVKAQQVKNAVIVPVGAKGGFLPKRLPPSTQRDAWLAEGEASYRAFINALLAITDNLVGDSVVPPQGVVRHDGDDPYLVVAADKGTASFSDIANAIAQGRGFWLGDAFASGGSVGYDHKKMGITARGAWEAVKRHFREIDTDIQTTPVTAAGVGDMSGDVFGNGMLLSPVVKLIAAFDHRDIFIDPEPDLARARAERERLFALPRSSWQDYDRAAISAGGGVFSRAAKSIALSPAARAALGLTKANVSPDEALAAILRAPVDLLWFGGIGTYLRASDETDEQAGDRANDAIRATPAELRCKVIGEGANLGLTQKARIEAARAGLRLNTDAIDNSAGVNTSDVEVNIKIALAQPLRDGALDHAGRDRMLAQMTSDVGALVLRNNYLQTLAISLAERRGAADVGCAVRFMQALEAQHRLDRQVEFLPSDADLLRREKAGSGLTRPEISVLLAYSKLALHDEILATSLPDEDHLKQTLLDYFPDALVDRFPHALLAHRLRREIVATQIANKIVNAGGPFVFARLDDGASARTVARVRAFLAIDEAFALTQIDAAIDALDARINGAAQLELYGRVQAFLFSRMVWFTRNVDFSADANAVAARFRASAQDLIDGLDAIAPPALLERLAAETKALVAMGAPLALAHSIARLMLFEFSCDIALLAADARKPFAEAAAALFAGDRLLGLASFIETARHVTAADRYDRQALDAAIASLEKSRRSLALRALTVGAKTTAPSFDCVIDDWLKSRNSSIAQMRAALDDWVADEITLSKVMLASQRLADATSA